MMPMSKQIWNEGEKYLVMRIAFIYVLVFLIYVCPFLSLHHRATRSRHEALHKHGVTPGPKKIRGHTRRAHHYTEEEMVAEVKR